MRSSIQHLIKTLSPADREKIKQRIKGSQKKNKSFLLHLFEIIEEYLKPSRKKLSLNEKLKQSLKNIQIEKLKHQLKEDIEDFISEKAIGNDKLQSKSYILQWANRSDNKKLFDNAYNKIKTATSIDSDEFIAILEHRFVAEKEKNAFLSKGGIRKGNTNLGSLHVALEEEFVFRKIYYSCLSLNQSKIITDADNNHFKNDLLESALDYAENQSMEPITKIYYYIYQTLNRPQSKYFKGLLLLIKEHQNSYSPEEVRKWNIYALNHSIRKINSENQYYLEEALRLYQLFLEESPLRTLANEQGKLHPLHYKNIVMAGCRLGKLKWTVEFIQKYEVLLPPAQTLSSKDYFLALLLFFQGKYREASEHFMEAIPKLEDVFWQLDAHTFFYMACFECLTKGAFYASEAQGSKDSVDWHNELESLSKLRMRLTRLEHIPEKRKEKYAAFRGFMQSLYTAFSQVKKNTKVKKLEKLKRDISQSKVDIAGKDWLLRKVNRLLEDLNKI